MVQELKDGNLLNWSTQLTRTHTFFVGNDRYVLNEDNQTVISQPTSSNLTYTQTKQLNRDNHPIIPPKIKKTIDILLKELAEQRNWDIDEDIDNVKKSADKEKILITKEIETGTIT